jgi:predicted nucleic acid-binding protein
MKQVFVDTVFYVALVRPGDQWQSRALQAKKALGTVRLVTTDEVLTEFLAALSAGGEHLRQLAVKMVRAIHDDPNTKVIPQSRESFLEGTKLYELRLDKEYSLTDCISMNTMREEGISEVLTNDHHFEQEGFAVLIK